MVRYKYNSQLSPPAPFVHVTIRSPDNHLVELPAQIDTAADQTVIPRQVAEQLGLNQLDTVTIGGLNGIILSVPTYLVAIEMRGQTQKHVEVLGCDGESYVLLGRDVINDYTIRLIGRELALEVD